MDRALLMVLNKECYASKVANRLGNYRNKSQGCGKNHSVTGFKSNFSRKVWQTVAADRLLFFTDTESAETGR